MAEGTRRELGNKYHIKLIPKYILIGKHGKIINSNINEPSITVVKEIDKAFRENQAAITIYIRSFGG